MAVSTARSMPPPAAIWAAGFSGIWQGRVWLRMSTMRAVRITGTLAWTRQSPSLPPSAAWSRKPARAAGSNTIWVWTKSAPAATLRPSRASSASLSGPNGSATQPRASSAGAAHSLASASSLVVV